MNALLVSAILAAGLPGPSSVLRFTVVPSQTDPAIQAFDSPHAVFIDPSARSRGQLLVFLPGTNGATGNTNAFCSTAAEVGYQVINLMYPDDIAATVVRNDEDRDAFLKFRLAVIEGKRLSRYVDVDRADSIENRLIKLLQYLNTSRPAEHWGSFLTSEGQPNWPKIAFSGLSQGAGHAALIAIRHKVARAILFGGPKDYDRHTRAPAAWYTPPQTPLESIYTFNHVQDNQGCNITEQLQICRTMGLEKFGQAVSVDSTGPPFNNSHILITNYPGSQLTSVRAHTSVVADGSSPKAQDGSRLFRPVWFYMLTSDGS